MKRLVLFLAVAGTIFGASSVRPQQLRCEYRVNPLGIDAPEPRLSWVLTPVSPFARGLRQTAYRVLVAGDRYFRFAFDLPPGRKVKRAVAVVGADVRCDVYFNGAKVASAATAVIPQNIDITAQVRRGENLLAKQAAHPRAGTPAGLIGAVRIEFESGAPLLFESGNAWRTAAKVEPGWGAALYEVESGKYAFRSSL